MIKDSAPHTGFIKLVVVEPEAGGGDGQQKLKNKAVAAAAGEPDETSGQTKPIK